MTEIDPVQYGQMIAKIDKLETEVQELRDDMKKLLELANKGQGGIWMFRTMYVAAGGLLAWLAPQLFERLK